MPYKARSQENGRKRGGNQKKGEKIKIKKNIKKNIDESVTVWAVAASNQNQKIRIGPVLAAKGIQSSLSLSLSIFRAKHRMAPFHPFTIIHRPLSRNKEGIL